MDSYMKAANTKRFVVEDSITKVTSDGEPHEMMTMIAGLSGLIAAVAILAVLVSLVGCKKGQRARHVKNCPSSIHSSESIDKLPCDRSQSDGGMVNNSLRSSISTLYNRTQSIPEETGLTSVSVIYKSNLEGNLNSAFAASELNLSGSLHRKPKAPHWCDEMETRSVGGARTQETTIDIERY